MYQVLARKYRPRNFNELVGQNHVSRALTSALERGRLHHAYLFTGTRGVGKTTIARILAKCLNCETGVTSTPCETCATCKAVNEGRFIDLIEIDAASRTKVEDTRELLDNVPYAPTQGRYKVYLIDEVHMLSTHSFNALLKTLEEPPAHVKFLFATTDPQKLPITVISRCLQFTLRPLSLDEIRQHLEQILRNEQIAFDDDAIWQISEAAQGSVRDSLSLTDQAIAYGQGEIKHQDVKDMLGLIDRQMIYDLILAIHQNRQSQVSQLLLQFRQQALDVSLVLDQLVSTLHELALMQYLPDLSLRYSNEINHKIQQLASTVSAQDLQLYYQIACKGRADLQIAVTQEQGFEMTVLRLLAFRPLAVNEIPINNGSNHSHSTQAQLEQAEDNNTAAQNPEQSHVEQIQPYFEQHHPAQITAIQQNEMAQQPSEQQQHQALTSIAQDQSPAAMAEFRATVIGDSLTLMPEQVTAENSLFEGREVADSVANVEVAVQQNTMAESDSAVDLALNSFEDAATVEQADSDASAVAVDMMQLSDQEIFFLDPHLQHSAQDVQPAPQQSALEQAQLHNTEAAASQEPLSVLAEHAVAEQSQVMPSATADRSDTQPSTTTAQMPQDILRLQPIALEGDWDVNKWEYWFRSSDLSLAVQELAQQGVMQGQINDKSVFHISQQYQNLLVNAQMDLQQALLKQWPDTKFSVQYDELTELSPYQLQQQRKFEAQHCATALLQQEAIVKSLSTVFDAQLVDIQIK